MRLTLFSACLLAASLASAPAFAEPLTLEAVLALAEQPHPDLAWAQSQEASARAEEQLAASLNDFQVTLEGGLRGGRNTSAQPHFEPDHQARLNARKRLYDGARSSERAAAAKDELTARTLQTLDTRAQRRITLMARYFDVLLADMQYNADTEFMSVAYVAWDNAKDRHALGQIPAWQLSELEARYQDSRTQRNDTRRKLREKRMQLASAMNRADIVLDDLADPKLVENERAVASLPSLLAHAAQHNPRLQAQRQLLSAAQKRREAARADYRPSLEFEAEAAAWSRPSTTRDEVRAGLNFVLPLWHGGRQDAALAREQARISEIQSQHARLEQEVRESVLALSEEIEFLKDSERRSAAMQTQYREAALDKARAEYEMELKTNLGASMAETQTAQIRRRAAEYRLALSLARLEAVLGSPLTQVKQKESP